MTVASVIAVACALVAYGFFAVQSVVLAVVDARTHRLPDRYVLPGYPVAGVLLAASALGSGTGERLFTVVGGSVALFGFYLLLRMLRPRAMGGGDVKLAGVVGAYLGFLGWDVVLVGALAGFLLAGFYGVILLLARRARASDAIPFGPWMLGGAWFAILATALPALGVE
jgi:leader peptidase (prepilin peptidase)/N-methyltransferase